MWLSIAQQAASSGLSLVSLSYIASIAAIIIGALWALKKYNNQERDKWLRRGKQEQDLTDKLDANVEATNKLAASMDKLTQRFDGYASRVDGQLNGHDRRIEKLEDYAVYGTAPYRRTNPPEKS